LSRRRRGRVRQRLTVALILAAMTAVAAVAEIGIYIATTIDLGDASDDPDVTNGTLTGFPSSAPAQDGEEVAVYHPPTRDHVKFWQCVDARVNECLGECVVDYGIAPEQCLEQICDPDFGINTVWMHKCDETAASPSP